MKILTADKVKGVWSVTITKVYGVRTQTDVINLARYEGLKVNKEVSNEKRIFAD